MLAGLEAPPEVHCHLHCFCCILHQDVVAAPKDHLINQPSVSRLVTISDETNDYSGVSILQDFD